MILRYAAPAAVAALVCAGVTHQWAGAGLVPTMSQIALPASMALAYSSLGALVLAHRPGHRVGRLMAVVGALAALATVSVSWPSWPVTGWAGQWAWWPPIGLIPLLLLVFPDGRLPSPRWRGFAVFLTISALLPTVALASVDGQPLLDGVAATGADRALLRIAWLGFAATAVGLLGVLVALGGRFRGASLLVRRQLLAAVAAGVLVLLGELLDTAGVPVAWVAEGVALPLAVTVAILRLGLYELDVFVNRALVWLVLTAAVTATYVLVVGVVLENGVGLAALALTAVVATSFEPARRALQRAVDRLVYGRRDDPYTVLYRLGRHLEEVVEPTAVLPRLAAAITEELQVPYAAIQIADAAAVFEHGRRVVEAQVFPLVTHQQEVGALLVSPRRAGEAFTRAELRLLRALARQAAVAVEAYRLTLDLRRSRERIVLAREEERRRLRADLHDGLGPGLAGMAMQVRAARRRLDSSPLEQLSRDLEACSAEVRALVDGLRPPALNHGLPAALRQMAASVDCPDDLGELPAAVEVAAFRIAAEAVNNSAKHADATVCRVVVSRSSNALEVTISDDGRGFPAAPRPDGVGLGSMRERAEELSGTCSITSSAARGTTVEARLPLAYNREERDAESRLASGGAFVERPVSARVP